MSSHAVDNRGDRALGKLWEQHFCHLAKERGFTFLPHQLVRDNGAASAFTGSEDGESKQILLPDITVWGNGTEHHEVKHKNPTKAHEYGLEQYRLERLVDFAARTNERVLYTIHDWGLAGASSGRDEVENHIEHWRTVDILALNKLPHRVDKNGLTYLDGERTTACIWYWPTHYWVPLKHLWEFGAVVNTSYVDFGVRF